MKGGAGLFGVLALLLAPAVRVYGQADIPPKVSAEEFPAATASVSKDDTGAEYRVDPAKEAEIRKTLRVIGMEESAEKYKEFLLNSLVHQKKPPSPDFVDHLEKNLDTRHLVEQQIAVYDKYYSLSDLQAINAFYATTAGQHLIAATTGSASEIRRITQEWSQQAFLRTSLQMPDVRHRMNEIAPGSAAPAKSAPGAPVTSSAPSPAPSVPVPATVPPAEGSATAPLPPSPQPILDTGLHPVMKTSSPPLMNLAPQPLMNTSPAPIMGTAPAMRTLPPASPGSSVAP